MMAYHKTLLGASILTLAAIGCVDPEKSFENFASRVPDAAPLMFGEDCEGIIPDATGEFYLNLAINDTGVAVQFRVKAEVDLLANPKTIGMELQPLCVQAEQCEVGANVGEVFSTVGTIENDCKFAAEFVGVPLPGGANPLSGAEIPEANLAMDGTLASADLFCGQVNGKAVISIDGSQFGAVRIGDDGVLPAPVAACPQ